MVTNHDASIYPTIKVPSEHSDFVADPKARVISKKQHQLLFDRILCDVPCSGDGTMRKNPGIWKNWSPMDGNGLHGSDPKLDTLVLLTSSAHHTFAGYKSGYCNAQ